MNKASLINKLKTKLYYIILSPQKYAKFLGVKMGKGCLISTKGFPSEAYLISFGDYVRVAPKTHFFTHGGLWPQRFRHPELILEQFGKIKVGDYSYLGESCLIMPGVEIGSNCIVGAGSIVTKSVPDGMMVAGNPAKIIGKTENMVQRVASHCPIKSRDFYKLRGGETKKLYNVDTRRIVDSQKNDERMKRNILLCISHDNMTRGGAEEIMRMVAFWFLQNGYDVYVFFLQKRITGHWDALEIPNLHLYYTRGGGKLGIFSLIYNFWSVRRLKFDYSFSSIVLNSAIVGIMTRLRILQIKHMVARESTMTFKRFSGFQLQYRKLLYNVGYKPSSLVICQNDLMRKDLLHNIFWLKQKKVEVIPNPVDLYQIHEREKEIIDVSKLGNYIVTAGRFIPEKGYDVLVAAFAKIHLLYPNLKLVILGDGGNQREMVSQEIKKYKLEKSAILYGRVDNVYPFFRAACLCVISSRIEGFPNVLLQMMSQNNRVVSTICAGGIDEIKGIVTCRPNDVDALFEAIKEGLTINVSDNRVLYDKELDSRSIDSFVKKVFKYCEE